MFSNIELVVDRCRMLGLLSVTEKTAVAIVTLVIQTHGVRIQAAEAHNRLSQFKVSLRKMRNLQKGIHKQTLLSFPEDVTAFTILYTSVYTESAPPVMSAVDTGKLSEMRAAMPCRKSHASLRNDTSVFGSSSSGSQSSSSSFMNGQLQNFLMPMLQSMLGNSSPHGNKRSRQELAMTMFPDKPSFQKMSAPLALGDVALATPAKKHRDADTDDESDEANETLPGTAEAAEPVKPMGIEEVAAAVRASLEAKKAKGALEKLEKKNAESGGSPGAAGGRGRGGRGKGRGKGRGNAAAEPEAKAKAGTGGKAAAKPKAKAKAAKPMVTKRPPCPAFKKVDPMHYLSCTVYCDAKQGLWRAVEWSNRRKDKKFRWTREGWADCMKWCEENSKQ